MKQLLLILLLFLFQLPLPAQEDPAALARELTSHCTTEKEKVKAIFYWITENISYKLAPRFNLHIIGKATRRYTDDEAGLSADDSPLKPLNERVACDVMRNKEAFCVGYARLFTTLCDFAGIRSTIIIGYARSSANKPLARFGVNHYWNAVYLDGEWRLLDATWASGYLSDEGDRFIKDYDDRYFLPSPEEFIKDHYPDDIRWTLLPASQVPEEFRYSPFKQKSFLKYTIHSFSPASGIIEAEVGETIHLELVATDPDHDKRISPDMLVDSSLFTHSPGLIFLQPSTSADNQPRYTYSYQYTVTSPDVEWLYLLYNDDLVLRYKIRVKKKKA